MRIPIAKEGYIFIVPLGVLSLVCWLVSWEVAALIFTLLFVFVVSFFRDPKRSVPEGENLIVSPADGKITEIVTEKDPLMGKTFTRITIFLSIFNVHVNRAPISGKIEQKRYSPGKFLAAFNPKASQDNEQNILLFRNGSTDILVKQIAGLIARRIVCWANTGDNYSLGQRFGLIRFGSRVDIFVPEDTQLAVRRGDRVKGALSIIGYLPKAAQ